MGRWKTDPNAPGGRIYDPNDTGPDQPAYEAPGGGGGGGAYQPSPGASLKPGESGAEANDWLMPSGGGGGGGGLPPSPPPIGTGPTFGYQPLSGNNSAFQPPPGATRNEWGYYVGANGDLSPGQTTPGMAGMSGPPEGWIYPGGGTSPTGQAPTQAPTPAAPGQQGVPSGFDPTKWNNADYKSPKYVVGRIIAGGGTIQQAAQAVGGTAVGKDTIRLPDGTMVDVIQDEEGAHLPAWFVQGAGAGTGTGAGARAGAGAGPGFGGFGQGAGGMGTSRSSSTSFNANQLPPEIASYYQALTQAMQGRLGQDAAVQQSLRDQLLRLMGQGGQPVDMNDPVLRAQADVFRNAKNRQNKQDRAAVAERLAFEGLNPGGQGSGAFNSYLESSNENTGNAVASHEAGLAAQELQTRRSEVLRAMDIANAIGARQESAALQNQLAGLDAQLRRESLAQQQGQYEDTNAFNWAGLEAELNRQALLAGLGRG